MESPRAQTWKLDFWGQGRPSPTPCTNRMTPGKSLQLPECEFSDWDNDKVHCPEPP